MAETSIGPRIAVTGEAEFKAAVASINNEFKLLGSEMKLAVSQFDRNDKSTEALTAQNEVLGRQIDSQRGRIALLTTQYDNQNNKLATLKTSLDATKEAFAADSAEVAQAQRAYDRQNNAVIALQTQLNGATAGLNNMERSLESNNQAIEENSNNLGEFGEKMKTMGAAVAVGIAAIGAAFLGAVVGGVSMSDDLTKALNGVQAATGTTDEGMGDMRETMLDIYNDNFGENLEEIGVSMGVIHQQTGLVGDALKGMSEDALLVRDAFGMEVADSVKAADQLVVKYGMDGHAAYNLIAQGAQKGLDANGDLLDTLKEYSGTFKEQGFAAEEMMNMLKNGADSGVRDLDLLGDAMKEFGIRSKDGSDASAAGFEALGLDAEEMTKAFATGGESSRAAFDKVTTALIGMKDPVAQNATGVALWGTQFEDLGVKSFTALVNTKGSITDTTDALKKINDVKYNDFGSAVEGIKRQLLTGLVLPLGEEVLPKMNEFGNYLKTNLPQIIEQIKPVINGFVDTFKILADNMSIIIPALAGVVGGILAFNIITGVSGLIKAFQLATEGAAIAQGIFNIVLAANPIGIAAIAIAALVAAGVALWMNWDTISAKATEIFGAIKVSIGTAMDWVVNLFTVTIPGAITSMLAWFGSMPSAIGGGFANILSGITAWGSSVASWVETAIPKIIEGIINFFNELPGKIGYALGYAIGTLIKWGIDAADWVIEEVPKIITGIVDFFTELPGKLAIVFTNVMTGIGTWGTSVINWVATEVPKFISGIVDFFSQLPGKIGAHLSAALTSMVAWMKDMSRKVSTEIPKIVTSIADFFKDLPGDMLDIGVNIVEGLWEGIKNTTGWLWDKIGDFCQGILDGLKDGLGINSPSKLTMEMGVYVGEGLAIGMENQTGRVALAMQSMVSGISGVNFSPTIVNGNIPSLSSATSSNYTSGNSSGPSVKTGEKSANGDLIVNIENLNNNRPQDVQAFAEELEFYRKQTSAGKGG